MLCLWLMYRAWQKKARKQADAIGELPAVPAELGAQLLEPTTGLYTGTTMAPSWQNRVAVGDLGFRATAELTRFERGILLERGGADGDLDSAGVHHRGAHRARTRGQGDDTGWCAGDSLEVADRDRGGHRVPRRRQDGVSGVDGCVRPGGSGTAETGEETK